MLGHIIKEDISMIINTNVQALFAQNALYGTQNTLQTLQEQLSTGLQINSPADNPSGLAISNSMQGEIGGLNAAISNANQGINYLNTANGGMQTDIQIVQQIEQLATQAANSTNNSQDTAAIQQQINNLLSTLNNVSQTVNSNQQYMLSGAYGAAASITTSGSPTITNVYLGADTGNLAAGTYSVAVSMGTTSSGMVYDNVIVTNASTSAVVAQGSVTNITTNGTISLQLVAGVNATTDPSNASFVVVVNQADVSTALASAAFSVTLGSASTVQLQVGPNNAQADTMSLNFGAFNANTLGLSNISVTTSQGAQYAITQAQNALSILSNAQAYVGANVDQLNSTISNLQTESTNLQASKSTIMDANMAQVTSQFAQEQVLLQTGLQALQTADQLPGMVLKLLG